jgi:hypothetical protein
VQTEDQAAFLALMVQLGVLYKQAMQAMLMELYWVALERFALSAVKQAVQAHVNHPDKGQYMPKPADLLRHLEGSGQAQALRAWSTVAQAIREVGGYSSVVFDDPLIHAVIADMGGWMRLCQILISELPFREHVFVARYRGYLGRPPADYPRQLIGTLAHQQTLSQSRVDPVVCIGDRQKARRVYAQGKSSLSVYSLLPLEVAQEGPSAQGEGCPVNPCVVPLKERS